MQASVRRFCPLHKTINRGNRTEYLLRCCSAARILHSERPACDCRSHGWVAQLAEQWTENPRVGGSIPPPATIFANVGSDIWKNLFREKCALQLCLMAAFDGYAKKCPQLKVLQHSPRKLHLKNNWNIKVFCHAGVLEGRVGSATSWSGSC
jgi:hypothetical protein